MPFLKQIADFINESLKENFYDRDVLERSNFRGLSTIAARSKVEAVQSEIEMAKREPYSPLNNMELFPAIVEPEREPEIIMPDEKYAVQLYHRLMNTAYSIEKKSTGDGYNIKSVSELSIVAITNSKLTGRNKTDLEPVVLFGIPQRLSPKLMSGLGISNCLITPISSNMNHVEVFRQEYPQSDYALNEEISMFLIRYKTEMIFSRACE